MAGLTLIALPAGAVPAPIQQRTPSNVTADALPTAQINGVVTTQAIVGNTVYAGGTFTSARPPGAAAGTNESPRTNLMSYTLSTGALDSWAPSLNGKVKAITASPDGSRIYVGGQFTTADGMNRYRIAAYSTATGQLVSSFAPALDASVNAIAATNTTVYVGGVFSKVGNVARTRLAAFSASNGALLGWAPTADSDVLAMVLSPDGSRVIIGGSFQNVNGAGAYGMAALDSNSAASVTWNTTNVVRDAGANAGILSLSTDGTSIFGTGYVFGAGGNLEGTFSADPSTGNINWIEDCHGDTYGAYSTGSIVYSISHSHYCSDVGSFPQTNPWTMHYALAWTAQAKGTLDHNQIGGYYDFFGQPAPAQINWYPTLQAGTFTGQGQAAWSVTGTSQYLALGGEFPTVNGTGQQGLVRFAVPSLAPNKRGPQVGTNAWSPSVRALSSTTARVAWQTNWDQDDQNLTYTVVRSGHTVYTGTATSQFWNRPSMAFNDTGLSGGSSYQYYVKAVDPDGNANFTATVSITMPTNMTLSQYASDVFNDGATDYWRLDEAAGATTSSDWAGTNNLIDSSGVTMGAAGAINGDSDTAASFSGSSSGSAGSTNSLQGPDTFTEEMWVKTTSTRGGKILGFGGSQTGSSSSYDRHVYMDNSGHVIFGVYPNQVKTLVSPKTYNDGQWHQIAATLSTAGMVLYVDGLRVGRDTSVTFGQSYTGYWRVGGDNLNSWTNKPTSQYLNGSIDEVAIYPTALSAAQVQQHYTDSGRTAGGVTPPSDTYGKAVFGDSPDLYWRLDDASGPTAADASPYRSTGVYAGGVTYKVPSSVSGATGTAVTFNGTNGTIGSSQQYTNPTVYSEEAWFNTTTNHGGKIIGFADTQGGLSTNYDRHVFMNDDGTLVYGVWTGVASTITTSRSYNDGNWHHVVATQGPDGMHLYVDAQLAGTNSQTGAQSYTGYWRVGGGSDWGGTSPFLAGTIDEVAVYSIVLTPAQVQAHYLASGAAANILPTASFTKSCLNLTCNFDGSNSSDPDGSVASYAWDFGDGSTGTGVSPSHTYAPGTYTVTLRVTDNRGGVSSPATDTVTATSPPNQPPTAQFTANCTDLSCSFDGSGSSDPDGTVASYAWDFGDGTTGTGANPSHTYAAGTYTVTLTVTDNQGATSTPVTHTVSPTAANQLPTATFTNSCTNLACSFDGTGSSDPDGTISAYAWDFGDGATSTASQPNHTFATGGSYNVSLQVTDNQGGKSTVFTKTITVSTPTNQLPTASFTQTCSNLTCNFDASASSDPDGTIASYDWDFGDGSTGTGVTASRSYAAAGTYSVKLTVTDNQGGTDTKTVSVVVNPAGALATDTFTRTVATGWGTADVGGAWTATSGGSLLSVDGSVAKANLKAAGNTTTAYLNSISQANVSVLLDAGIDVAPTGNGAQVAAVLRHTSAGDYRVKIRFMTGGVIHLAVSRVVSGTETTLREVNVTGLTYTPGQMLRARFQITGTGTTTLAGRVWLASDTEPASNQITQTDTTPALQVAGSVGILGYSASGTIGAVIASVDNLSITPA